MRPAPSRRVRLAARVLLGALAGLLVACGVAGNGGAGGAGGGGGAGGSSSCPDGVSPLFTLRLRGPDGELPPDLTLAVSWSAGDEPVVVVDQPGTFGSSTSNVICALRPLGSAAAGGGGRGGEGGEGEGGEELVCELWTSGPTRVELSASGFVPFDDTLVPATVEGCDRPVPSEVVVELVVEAEEETEAE